MNEVDDKKSLARKIWEVVIEPPSIVALVYSAIVFFGNLGVDLYKTSRDHHEKLVADQVVSFLATTHEFDALLSAFAYGVLEKDTANLADRTKLIANLTRQYSEIQDLRPLVKESHDLDTYKEMLVALNDQLPKSNSVTELRAYWERVSDILVTRRILSEKLKKSAKLNVD
jgi:hypothetical protein